MMRALTFAFAPLLAVHALPAQSYMERSPGISGTWTLDRSEAAFSFAHRFEFLNGGDEVINVPTLDFAIGLPLGLTAGLDYTSNSEIVPSRLGQNETQYWLKRAVGIGEHARFSGLAAYNTNARSLDGALSARTAFGPVALLGELRGFSHRYGEDRPGMAGTVGAVLRLTPYLGISGDVGQAFFGDSPPAVWSAGVALAIPGSPHTLSMHATNGGAITLQGAAHRKEIGAEKRRYGFIFTVPLGTGARWARIFRPGREEALPMPPAAPMAAAPEAGAAEAPVGSPGADSVAVTVEIRQVAYAQKTVRIHAGQSVAWVNRDPLQHTVTGDDGKWSSPLLSEGQRFVQRFDRPGRYKYHCLPHPQMQAVVIVEK